MQKIILITIDGDFFLFDNNLSKRECADLQVLANSETFRKSLNFHCKDSVLSQFIYAVNQELNIFLKLIKVSSVIRIR